MNNRPTTVQDRIVSVRADPCKTSTLLVTSGAQQLGRYPYAIVERDGFRIGVVRPPGSWLTTRHNQFSNLMAMDGHTSIRHSVKKLVTTVPEPYYDDCATGECTFCNIFRAPHYDFSASELFWWTGRYEQAPPAWEQP